MGYQTQQYANANALQQSILLDVLGYPNRLSATKEQRQQRPAIEPKQKCDLIRTWIELEFMKREMRGIPRLKPAELSSLMKRAKDVVIRDQEPLEIEEAAGGSSEPV